MKVEVYYTLTVIRVVKELQKLEGFLSLTDYSEVYYLLGNIRRKSKISPNRLPSVSSQYSRKSCS